MGDIGEPDILVQRLHQVAVRYGLTVKDMAEKCGVPKSSLEGYMRLKGAKRPGIDALILISEGLDVSLDWLVGKSQGELVGEDERTRITLAVHKILCEVLLDISKIQTETGEIYLKDGMVGNRKLADYAQRMMLYFLSSENIFPADRFDTFRIFNQILEETDDNPNALIE